LALVDCPIAGILAVLVTIDAVSLLMSPNERLAPESLTLREALVTSTFCSKELLTANDDDDILDMFII